MRIIASLLFASAIVVAGVAIGGRYTVAEIPKGNDLGGLVYVIDRFTGEVKTCDKTGCARLR